MLDEYFDLTSGDITQLSIEKTSVFNCSLEDKNGRTYKGFLLSKTKGGKAFTVCDLDFQKSNTDDKYQPRLILRKTDENFVDKTVLSNAIAVRIPFHNGEEGYREFWKMIWFLYKFKHLVDFGDFEESYTVVDSAAYIMQFKTKEEAEKIRELSELFLNASEDTIKQALEDTRRETLKIFLRLLNDKNYWKIYQTENYSMIGEGEEAVWHHFLKKHDWVLGLNADIRFIRDLLSQVEVGITDSGGAGSPIVDILGISDYTLLVELKTPNTDIFTEKKEKTSRANTWSFSSEFIDGVSQCLGQKFDWEKCYQSKPLVNEKGEEINKDQTRNVDPKSILLIGNKTKELPEGDMGTEVHIKRDTFQRFRRNNRNVEIVTFDELYERAYFIVHNKKPELLPHRDLQVVNNKDIPF